MSSFSGAIQRPLVAAAAVAVASFSADISDKLPFNGSSRDCSTSSLTHSPHSNSIQESDSSWVSHISDSKLANLSFVNRIRVPVPNVQFRVPSLGQICVSNLHHSSIASSPSLLNLYHYADLPRVPRPCVNSHGVSNSTSEVMYKWHLPESSALSDSNCSFTKSKTVVVLLGWLGARQKHLKKYAEWYTSKGFHVITFTFPMGEILSYQPGGKAEQNVHLLVDHLADWLEGENEKNLVFHTFSNTGWLIYGVMLEHFQEKDPSIMERIRGCIVDSAPVAYPDPQVWASGFSAAFLKKNSVATKGRVFSDESGIKVSIGGDEGLGVKPAATEAALLLILKKFFEVILHLPSVNRRLSDVLIMLSSKQPNCPQLYIYSSADRVIPADSVESFVEAQRRAGHDVRACNFVSSPHVDHFRNDPKLYTSQLSKFLEECVS
ncbi:transmembrane protein 53 [Abrus precatorius]|uniref:Transmembrane protein 53 n=1 Tax=Abrus precatorius TaxID=3816 RepID=A0A8B8MFJ5_ABRPR|nr:transmembrane protein 53 [Abrus precatorius]XP_027365942.1 transmembrane protein 53 [Abrus precatorius]XP_027365943.1 transmembrane protein 53 [Abrus precatorius]XP_027365944.1 transmembrane protein 53 [Abrus precatorius]